VLVGRNGVLYDRQGRDWDAQIVKIVEHPISIRQAFWMPYKKLARMIGEGIEKFAAARSKAVDNTMQTTVANVATTTTAAATATDRAPPPPPPQAFDAAKFAGIFAAIGLAVGALGTALASIVTGFIGLSWWQMPLAVLGVVLLFSGPSVLIAYMKLRQRNLAPLLDANGWAVNTRAKINIPFGTALTVLARLPEGAERALSDPYAEKERPWKLFLTLAVIVVALVLAWRFGAFDRWL
jgi:MFS family permease